MEPSRRHFLVGIALAAASAAAAGAHTPYGQWVVYRQKHLLIGAHRGDGRTYELAQAVVAALEQELPEARARVARGPRPQRIASLIGTGQMLTAVLSEAEAESMAEGRPPFDGYRPTPLRALAALGGGYLLVASPDLPEDHAWLITQALGHAQLGHAPEGVSLPIHPGAAALWSGAPRPS
jgi:TRAP-type uncharacterized transport system substrate-binding protein